MQCPNCGGKDIDFNDAGGHSACVTCGTVVEENTIVSSIEFQETGDRSSVIGQFVSATSSKPFNSAVRARGRYGNNRESRDATLANARRVISQIASSLRLPSLYVDRAYRMYQMALSKNFIMGRRVLHVVATCLYTVCRQEKSPHLLIDFSDALQINVYVLGKAFLQFSRTLNIRLPIVDPSLYIHRFAARLELGDKVGVVITTALRIVTRLKKDWITQGRRPDGVCAVSLLIASRCHGFHKSQGEIAKLFRISADTLQKRVEDFRATPAAQLTVDQFHMQDFDMEFDPPSFIRGALNAAADNDEGGEGQVSLVLPGAIDDDVDDDLRPRVDEFGLPSDPSLEPTDDVTKVKRCMVGTIEIAVPVPGQKKKRKLTSRKANKALARRALYDNIYEEIRGDLPEGSCDNDALLQEAEEMVTMADELGVVGGWGTCKPRKSQEATQDRVASRAKDHAAAAVPCSSSSSSSSSATSSGGDDSNANMAVGTERDDDDPLQSDETLMGVAAASVEDYILTEEERRKRSAIWESNFRPFMDERARRKQAKEESELARAGAGGRVGKRKYSRRDSNRESASEAVLQGFAVKKTSKKINYDRLEVAFTSDGNFKLPSGLTAGSTATATAAAPTATTSTSATSSSQPAEAPVINSSSSSSSSSQSRGASSLMPKQRTSFPAAGSASSLGRKTAVPRSKSSVPKPVVPTHSASSSSSADVV